MIFSDETLLAGQDNKKTDPSDSGLITRNYLDLILIEERLIDSVVPDISVEMFGRRFDTPVLMPAFSHMGERIAQYFEAAKELNALNFIGMCEDTDFEKFIKINPVTFRVVKPYADRGKMRQMIRTAEECGAFGVGIDIDHSFGGDGNTDNVFGDLMQPLTSAELRDFVRSTRLPLLVKGVLSVHDAVQCERAGAKGILLSHHSNIFPYAVPPIMMLPEVRKALGESSEMHIFLDCSITRGADCYKAMALGAKGAAIGRAMMKPLLQDGTAGVIKYVTGMNREFKRLMARTGIADTDHFDPSALWIGGKQVRI